ncbi:zinc finger protein 569-like [Branchiostoma floridae]|uniref:Zinc finger protein 569-like n=1 Tax=Branchiostoma floridae TaxID=7739 RepID=A0A9J7HMD0_BRAFL|nr:zinc finger protein 569-like [Branchiostoma floridae]
MVWLEHSMSIHQEIICGLSHEVTIAVLPRLNMEELMFELNRRIQNLDKENSIKDRLVSILRDVMLEEYRQVKKKSQISSPDEMNIPKELELNTDQEQLTGNIDSAVLSTPTVTSLIQLNTHDHIEEEGITMMSLTEDEAAKACHDELNIDSPTFSQPVLDTINPKSNSSTEKLLEGDKTCEETSLASCELSPEHNDVREWQYYLPEDDQIGQVSQQPNMHHFERCTDEGSRETGFSNNGHEQRVKDSSEDTPLAPYEPTLDHSEVHIKMECHVSKDYQVRQSTKPSSSDHLVDRQSGSINSGHEQSKDQSDKHNDILACEEMSSLAPFNNIQTNHKPYVCNVCGLRTMYPHNLAKHMQRHTGEKTFMCGECGYRAYHKYRLVEHMRTHTGEKPYKCNLCSFKAAFKGGLRKHMKNHANGKQIDAQPYSCAICDHRTYRMSDMKRHMKAHTGDTEVKPYECEECDYRTTHKKLLTRHRKRHTGERPYRTSHKLTSTLGMGVTPVRDPTKQLTDKGGVTPVSDPTGQLTSLPLLQA